ncbi:uncharacterized protein [Lepisosteus oculatus]|uniref:uncharacterized protein n=1 Tax=Lepisosteus oculatus TaxID=7918 RepID=UPI0035F5196C
MRSALPSLMAPLLIWALGSAQGQQLFSSEGGTVSLPCDGVSSCDSVSWKYNTGSGSETQLIEKGQVVTTQTDRAGRLTVLSDCSLHIHNLKKEDTGQYTCGLYSTRKKTVSLSLLSVNFSLMGEILSLYCRLYPDVDSAKCNKTKNLRLTWVDEQGAELKDRRFRIIVSPCESVLTMKLRDFNRDQAWRCDLREEDELKASVQYRHSERPAVPGSREVFAPEGGSLHLPCLLTADLEGGEKLVWTFQRFNTSLSETLYTLVRVGTPLKGQTVDDRVQMAQNTSLLISQVRTQDSGVYKCSRYQDTKLLQDHQSVALNTLSVSADHTGEVQQGSNITLTCSLTCGLGCGHTELSWRDSTGVPLQGGASERTGQTVRARIVRQPQGPERILCIAIGDGAEITSIQEWTIDLKDKDTPGPSAGPSNPLWTVLVPLVLAVVLVSAAVGLCVWRGRKRRMRKEQSVGQSPGPNTGETPYDEVKPAAGGQVTPATADENYASVTFNPGPGGAGPAGGGDAVIYSAVKAGS